MYYNINREHCKVILLLKNKLKKKKIAIHKIIHAKKKNPVVLNQTEVIWPLIQTISLVMLKKQVAASLVTQRAKHLPAMSLIPGLGRPMEKEIATYSSIPAWRIPWMEEPGRLQSMGSQRVGHD